MTSSSLAFQRLSDSLPRFSLRADAWRLWAVPLLLTGFTGGLIAAASNAAWADAPVIELAQNTPAASSKNATQTKSAAENKKLLDSTFDDLKFEIEKDAPFKREMLPEKIEDYAGRRMRIRGFILPTSFQTGLTSFVLVRDNMECCFGPGAALYDCIVVELAEGKTTDYTIRPVAVEGKFTIDEFIGPGRKHLAIYKLIADKVE